MKITFVLACMISLALGQEATSIWNQDVPPIEFQARFNSTEFADRWKMNETVTVLRNASGTILDVQFAFRGNWNRTNDPDDGLPVTYRLRFEQEDWMLSIMNQPSALEPFGMVSVHFAFHTLVPATPVPLPIDSTVAVSGLLRFIIKFRYSYHYTNVDGSLRSQRGPNVTVVQQVIATLVGLSPIEQSIIEFSRLPFAYPGNPFIEYLEPPCFVAYFTVSEPPATSSVTRDQIYRRIIKLQDDNAIVRAIEGAVLMDWQAASTVQTAASIAEQNEDDYFRQKVMFFVALIVSLVFCLGFLGGIWFKWRSI